MGEKFEAWKSKYGKKYGADLNQHRFRIFKENANLIEQHNNSGATFKMGEN